MKLTLIALTMMVSFSSFAQDMSRTEKYEDSYRDLEDGSTEYIGGCSLHQDYEGKLFDVKDVVLKSFEPSWKNPKDTMKKLKHVELALLEAATGGEGIEEFYTNVDDVGIERITSRVFKHLDLYRFNIGVGGGNGYYSVFSREVIKGQVTYTNLSYIFDGDIEFCDQSVWLKK